MKKWKKFLLASLIIICLLIAGHLFYLSSLNTKKTYPEDSFLNTVKNKTALIVMAHDDDAISCAGTISQLTADGWKVYFLTFYGNWHPEDNPIRKKEVQKTAEIQKLAGLDLIDFSMQRSDTVKEPWKPIPYSQYPVTMKGDSLQLLIQNAIQKYQPTVIFTLDDIMGGYGHNEHTYVSQTVLTICRESDTIPGFPVQKIYQPVFPPDMNEKVLKNIPAFAAAKKEYKLSASPSPTVEISITETARQKKATMLAYASQHRNLKKFWPYYNWYPSWIYFRIFDKEYFRVPMESGE